MMSNKTFQSAQPGRKQSGDLTFAGAQPQASTTFSKGQQLQNYIKERMEFLPELTILYRSDFPDHTTETYRLQKW